MRSKYMLAAMGLVLAGAAQAADPGSADPRYYLGIAGGQNNLGGSWDGTVSLGAGVSLPGTVGIKRNSHWGVFGGRQSENARFELEYQRGEFDITSIHLGTLTQAMSTGGDYETLMLNAYRTAWLSDQWMGYAGLGIGWGRVSLPSMGFTSGCNCFPASSKSSFAYQGRLGVEYHMAPTHNAFLQYTWMRLPRPGSSSTPGVEYTRKSVGAWGIGYRHEFR